MFRNMPEIPAINSPSGYEGIYARLEQTLDRQWQVLKEITEKIKGTNEIVSDLEQEVNAMKRAFKSEEQKSQLVREAPSAIDVFTPSLLIDTKCGEKKDFEYALKLVSDFRLPLYVGQEFNLALRIMKKDGQAQRFEFPFFCSLKVYKATQPLEDVTSENSLLEGPTGKEFLGIEDIEFSNLMFTRGTAELGPGWVFVYVSVDTMDNVKPLVLENVRVKVRNTSKDKA